MVGSGPDDGDVLEIGQERPRRSWAIGRRSRLAVAIAGVCALVVVGGTLAGLRLSSRGPADPALARLITEVTTVPDIALASGSGSGPVTSGSYFGIAGAASLPT